MSNPPPTRQTGPGHGSRALGAGLTLAVATALFAYGGMWLDGQLGTQPLFVILGVLWGFLGGTLHLVRVLAPEMLPFGRRAKEPDRDAENPRPPTS